jgi:hypothetical protein
MLMSSCYRRIKEGEVLAAQRRHRAQHTAAGEAAAAQVAACLDSLQAEAQVGLGTCQRYIPVHALCCASPATALHTSQKGSGHAHSGMNSLLSFAGRDCTVLCGCFALQIMTAACTLQRFNVAAERLGLVAPGGGAGKRAAGVMYEARVDATASAAANILSADLKVHRTAMCSTLCGSLTERGMPKLGVNGTSNPLGWKHINCISGCGAMQRSEHAMLTALVVFAASCQ